MTGRFRLSTRTLILAVALLGFDLAAMIRAVQQGRAVGSVMMYAAGFGLVLLVLNVLLVGLGWSFARSGGRWTSTPSPALIAGLYLALMAFAILSVLFLSGQF